MVSALVTVGVRLEMAMMVTWMTLTWPPTYPHGRLVARVVEPFVLPVLRPLRRMLPRIRDLDLSPVLALLLLLVGHEMIDHALRG